MATLLFTPSFSYVYDPHRDLHSFPTRRSSDLSPGRPGGGGHRSHGSNAVVLGTAGRAGNPMPRSEEHTSELQSRGQLVCRLLLEKKNSKQQSKFRHRSYISFASVDHTAYGALS